MREHQESEVTLVVELARETLLRFIPDEDARVRAGEAADRELPAAIAQAVNELAALTQSLAYRDGVLTALAHPIVQGEIVDVTQRPPSGRPASDIIGRDLLPSLHIKGVRGAYQNIGKNQPNLVRGNNAHWDALLTWAANEATLEEIRVAYERIAAAIAATARTVLPKPRFRLAQLTFVNVMALVDEMLSEPTAGAHEQYVTAALLAAALQQESTGLRVQTKALNASDASSRSAGDVEVLHRNKLQEALEVSANHFDSKFGQAMDAMGEYGLSRIHIVAPGLKSGDYEELAQTIDGDVSILDPLALASTLVALLDRSGRESALDELYVLLDKHASVQITNSYVRRCWQRGLAEPGDDIPGAP
jgi:SacI restriction endonuclease